ncbi:Aste57867_2993 [Aphanomyces stellatus]|uniref:Aste57867_2993 protein n=1 Tax=Aphanomyces stellatus TaxID=120398 RepID=A0A485KAG1_9STRA|nr:hypothetical protein As57867_002984 [Aphanomyces stellatus]VFT80175.1 Aste57867_2993 [Aphanomyces stellatus]
MVPSRSEQRARSLLRVETFHSMLQRGDVVAARAMLSHDPHVARLKNPHNKKTTALMAATGAPNAIEMLQLLWRHSVSLMARDSLGRTVLLYACECGAAVATIEFLLVWANQFKRPQLDWSQRTKRQVGALVLVWRSASVELVRFVATAMPESCQNEEANDMWKGIADAIGSTNEAFVVECLGLPVIQAILRRTRPDTESGRRDGAIGACVQAAIEGRMQPVVAALELIEPAMVRRVVFVECTSKTQVDKVLWAAILSRYEYDVTWQHSRSAFLVLRRRCEGLPVDLSRCVASFLFRFNVDRETRRVGARGFPALDLTGLF